jgi:saposin
MEFLSSYYDPNLICSSMGVCGSGSPDLAKKFLAAVSHKVSIYDSTQQSSSTGCTICKAVVTELQTLDRDKNMQAELLSVVKSQGCARLPGQYVASCNNAVDLYGPLLFQLLATELDPVSRCTALGFCPSSAAGVHSLPTQSPPVLPPLLPLIPMQPLSPAHAAPKKLNLGDGPACAICELIMREVQSLITTNSTEQEIVAALEKVCEILPSTVEVACKSFVEIYGPAVVEMIIAELDPAQICTQLGLCSSVTNPPAPKLPLKAQDTETCIICETVIQYLEALVENNATVEQIEEALEKVCSLLPSAMEQQCDALIEQYGALIIHYVMALESPQQVCTLIGLCTDSKVARPQSVPMALLQPARRVGSSGQAAPGPQKGAEVKEVKEKVQLLGEKECSWGPAYWCASRENADKCKAVDHCKKNVWKH